VSVEVSLPALTIRRIWFINDGVERSHLAQAGVAGEVPVGAVIVDASGNLIAEAENRRAGQRPTAHAEILVLRATGQALQTGTSTNAPSMSL